MLFGTVLCLGDSLTRGARATVGYPERLAALMSRRTGVEWATLNRGVSGETTWQVLDRTPAAVGQLAGMAGAKWCVLLAGTNDSKPGGPGLDDWELLYRQVVHWPRRHKIPTALCTFPDVRPGVMPSYDARSREFLRLASQRVRDLVDEFAVDNPTRCVELAELPEHMLCDGVHLTPDGYAWVADRVAAVLTEGSP